MFCFASGPSQPAVACLLSASCSACCNSQRSVGMFPCRPSIHTHWSPARVHRHREERSSYRRDASCFGLYHNDHCSFISTLWGMRKQNVWHVTLPFSATLVTADRLPQSFLDVYCCCCGHWHHRICRWKKEECVKITGRKIWACTTKAYKRNGKLEQQEKGNVLVVKK